MAGLEPDVATLEGWVRACAARLHAHLAAVDDAPATGPLGAAGLQVAERVSLPIGEAPLEGGLERALDCVFAAAEASLNTIGPGYLAYVPGGGLYAAALGDYLANGLNRFTGLAEAAPALARLEADVLRFFAREFGYGVGAAGLLTSGGSLATWTAAVTARHAMFGDSGDYRDALVYTSSQTHRSVVKAARLAGVPPQNVRLVDVDDQLRLSVPALTTLIAADVAAGRRPFMVVAAAGTTNTGAIDPLHAIADVCAAHALWLHIDGAYGGAFVLCDEGRRRLDGIARADSIAFDPHKGMFLPYGTGCLLVRDGQALGAAHMDRAAYLQDLDSGAPGAASPADLGPELSRDFRGLRVWLPLMLHGAGAFREALAEKLALTAQLRAGLAALPIEVPVEPQLSVVPFRLPRAVAESLPAYNARNRRFLDRINARQRVCLSSTLLPVAGGQAFTPRACILSFRTHADRVAACLEDIAAAIDDGPR